MSSELLNLFTPNMVYWWLSCKELRFHGHGHKGECYAKCLGFFSFQRAEGKDCREGLSCYMFVGLAFYEALNYLHFTFILVHYCHQTEWEGEGGGALETIT